MVEMAGEPPLLRRDGRGYWRVEWRTADGAKFTRTFGRDRRQARNAYATWLVEWRRDPRVRNPNLPGPLTIREAFERWEAEARTHYRRVDGTPTREPEMVAYAMRPVLDLFEDLAVDALTPTMLREARQRWIDEGLSITTVNDRTKKVQRVWRWMVSCEIASPSTLVALRAVEPLRLGRCDAAAPRLVQPIDEDSVARTCQHLPPTLQAMVWVQFWSGMRSGDLVQMRPGDIDTRSDVWIYRPVTYKTQHHDVSRGGKRRREVFLGPKCQQWLLPYMRREITLPCFRPSEAIDERHAARRDAYQPAGADYRLAPSYLARARKGRNVGIQWTPDAYRQAVERACEAAGISPHWTPHQLRHAAGTRVRTALGLEWAQPFLGHACADVTEIYAERVREKGVEAARKLG